MAVYTDVGADELDTFIDGYDIGEVLSYKGIAEGVENSNFLLHTDAGHYILTLYEKRVATKDLPFFLGLMQHLAARGINCPQPVQNKKGETAEQARGPAGGDRHVPRRRVAAPRRCETLRRGRRRACAHASRRRGFFKEARQCAVGRRLAAALRGLPRARRQCGARHDGDDRQGTRRPSKSPGRAICRTGVIHGDLFPDNVFFLADKLSGLIDFYFACNDMFAYDAVICLNAWCFENDFTYNVTKGRAMLQAYAKVRPFTDAELDAMPLLARGAALRFLLTRLVDWLDVPPGALVKPKSPQEYLRKLRFHQKAKSVQDFGVEAKELVA